MTFFSINLINYLSFPVKISITHIFILNKEYHATRFLSNTYSVQNETHPFENQHIYRKKKGVGVKNL